MTRLAPIAAAMLLCLGSLGWAGPARAGFITIDFDFSGSTISILGGALVVPPEGSVTSASGNATVPGTAIDSAGPGGAQFAGLTLVGTINGTVPFATITGNFTAVQQGTAAGGLTGALSNVQINPPVFLDVDALIGCTGALCSFFGLSMPVTVNSVQTILQQFTLGIGNINSVGAATVNGVIGVTLAGFTAVINLQGTEVNRTFDPIPEPGTFALVGLGLLGIAGAGVRAARRR